jgi:hypothetical protein
MHTYSVALRIAGPDLDLAEVTNTLKLSPTQTRTVGQRRNSSDFVWPESMWEYEVRPPEGKVLWDSFEEGLRTVISAFVPRERELRNYQQRYKVFLCCADFSSSFGGGPTLSPQLLKLLADFGVELILETYFSDEPETE